MILKDSDRPTIKSYREFIKENNGGSDEVSEQALYDAGYLLFYERNQLLSENARTLKGNGELHRRAAQLEEENAYLRKTLGEAAIDVRNLLADKMILQSKLSELEQAYRNASDNWAEVSDEAYELEQELIKLKAEQMGER